MIEKDVKKELVKCFLEVQKSNLKDLAGEYASDKDIQDFGEKFLKKAFEETNGDYDNPKKNDFMNAMKWMIETAPSPLDICDFENHRKKMQEYLESLPE